MISYSFSIGTTEVLIRIKTLISETIMSSDYIKYRNFGRKNFTTNRIQH